MSKCRRCLPREKTGEVADGLVGEAGSPEVTALTALSAAALAVVLPLPPSPLLCPEPPKPDLMHKQHKPLSSSTPWSKMSHYTNDWICCGLIAAADPSTLIMITDNNW